MKSKTILFLIFFLVCLTCKKEETDIRDKFLGVYQGTAYFSKGCIKVDTIPEYDTILKVTMAIEKYGAKGLSCKSSFFSFNYDTLFNYSDTSIQVENHTGFKYVTVSHIRIIKDSLFFYYYNGNFPTQYYGNKCPIGGVTQILRSKKIF